jgi:hypothetical protein
MIVIVGVGGTGGWLCQLLGKTPLKYPVVTLIDGDKIEKKNLDRQLFDLKDIGKNKAERSRKHFRKEIEVTIFPEYLKLGSGPAYEYLMEMPHLDLFCCPDNHACRNACLVIADRRQDKDLMTSVVITGNETETGSADLYLPIWKDTPLDPRVRYPEIRTSKEGDPLHLSCTGEEVLAYTPQLALYNCLTASAGLWLMESYFHTRSFANSEVYKEIQARMPVSINVTANSWRVQTLGDL